MRDHIGNLTKMNIKYFYDASFDDASAKTSILAAMPGHEEFKKAQEKIHKMRQSKVNPEMMPCYEAPLLTTDQERHLFRQMNYFKYRAKQIVDSMRENPSLAKAKLADNMLQRSQEVRNLIAESNFRLSTMIMRHRDGGATDAQSPDNVLSDAYFNVLKAVDYFNFTLGIKFSTYATWVVKKNYFRDLKVKSSQGERLNPLDDAKAETLVDRSAVDEEKSHSDRQKLVKQFIGMLVRENLGTDRVRQAYVLENYFGINGREKKTLEQISLDIGVTKERVRQLKEKGLEWIREKVQTIGLEYDSDNPGDSVL